MLKDNRSKFQMPQDYIEEHRMRVARKNFVLIAITAAMSIYATGIALAVFV